MRIRKATLLEAIGKSIIRDDERKEKMPLTTNKYLTKLV